MRRNRRINHTYLGEDYVGTSGRSNKHLGKIMYYANVNSHKPREAMIDLVGMDFETQATEDNNTGKAMLMGIYMPSETETYTGKYVAITENIAFELFMIIKGLIKKRKHLAFWNDFDAYQMLRLFIEYKDDEESTKQALERFGKISGQYDNKEKCWEVRPVISIERPDYEIGIMQVIRSSIQFYIQRKDSDDIETMWAYNIKSLYDQGLEKEGTKRFEWYSKFDKSAHIVDWDRFKVDKKYKELVLKSNEADSRGAMALGYVVQKEIKEAYGYYPRSILSAGSLARTCLAYTVRNDIKKENYPELIDPQMSENDYKDLTKALDKEVHEKIKSLPLITHIDKWLMEYEEPKVKDLVLKWIEAYSGGNIEAYSYGSCDEAFYVDIATAYPSESERLWDLTGSTLEFGTGEPPHIEYAYTVIRGDIFIPTDMDYIPITIKHHTFKDTNVRVNGWYTASYTIEERDFMLERGATFSNEEWASIITKGEPSVLSHFSTKNVELRNYFIAKGSSTETRVKKINNSGYGITYEATPIYEERDGVPVRVGFRGGEFLNQVYAVIITSRTRIKINRGAMEIEKNGGQPILSMTDSLMWKGKASDLPINMPFWWGDFGIKETKVLGYFEPVEKVRNVVCLGAGLYGYEYYDKKTNKWENLDKRRGINIAGILNQEDAIIDIGFTWNNVLGEMVNQGSTELKCEVKRLISPPIVNISKTYTIADLGKITKEKRFVSAIAGKTKRVIPPELFDPENLQKGMYRTRPLTYVQGMGGDGQQIDGTYPELRELVSEKKMVSRKERARTKNRERQKRFYEDNKEKINERRKKNYRILVDKGATQDQARRYQKWNTDTIIDLIESGLTFDEYLETKEDSI